MSLDFLQNMWTMKIMSPFVEVVDVPQGEGSVQMGRLQGFEVGSGRLRNLKIWCSSAEGER